MKKIAIVYMAGVVLTFSCMSFATPKTVSHEQAASEAVADRLLANELRDESDIACSNRDLKSLFRIMSLINADLKAHPQDNLAYKARFAYSSCHLMLLDVSFITGACLNKTPSKYEYEYFDKQWEKGSLACDSEIEHPDLSGWDPDQTEEQWEAERRREGMTEEDIEFAKMLRKL